MDLVNRDTQRAVTISGRGQINDQSFEADGAGVGDASKGRWDFKLAFAKTPRDADPLATLLSVLILPTVMFGRAQDDAINLLTISGGELEFTQMLRADGVSVDAFGTIRQTQSRDLHWQSEAHGVLKLPAVEAVEPFDAIMLPQGHGRIVDVFALPAITSGGRLLINVIRQITFSPRSEMREIQLRRITIDASVRGNVVEVKTASAIRRA